MLGEELSPTMTDAHGPIVFVADPLDGTTNFLHGIPWYAVSIAAMLDGELQAAVVLNAANGELFTATCRRRRLSRRQTRIQPIAVSSITDPARVADVGNRLSVQGR